LAKNGSFDFAEALASCVGAKANVPFVRLAFLFVFVLVVGRPTLAPNVLGLCDGGELEVQMFSLVQMFIRIPNVEFSTEAPLLQNPCYAMFFCFGF
jgi:hypothetical protein